MARLVINGGIPLKGVVRLGGAKNSSFKLMIASLLCAGETRLLNFSRIADVDLTKELIKAVGGKVREAGERTLFINASEISNSTLPQHLGEASRASSMLLAPLLARTGKAIVPLPGGDKIGSRPLERHFAGLKAMGADIEVKDGHVLASAERLTGTTYRFAKNSHTGTETMIMAAVLASGETVLENAALEPEVDDLIEMLNAMGAKIIRGGNRQIKITGVSRLNPVIHKVMPDRNEAVSYAIAACVTHGDVVVENAKEEHLTAFLEKFSQAGGKYEIGDYGIRFYSDTQLVATDVTTKPHPGFMTDWGPLWSVLSTQSQGVSKIVETVFTNRFQYVKDLTSMGAKISWFDPRPKNPEEFYNFNLSDDEPEYHHGIAVTGPTPMSGGEFIINDIRAGATMALAGLAATGQTILTGLEHIDRGYEDFAGRLLTLGANIKTVD